MQKLAPAQVFGAIRTPTSFTREVTVEPRFAVGDRVVVRNHNPVGHTRLPGYAKLHNGVIDLHHGFFVYPDTMAHGLGDNPEHLYCVKFSAGELFGERGEPNTWVYVDMWDSYLDPEPAS
ncbi:nitrile hydratase subunit beta [Mycobacterium sp. 21AC1]|uniref:SH3-like domain-containing protein n=1 Tax=[Mycobacterium] appelbergii TaxID=2939269 RepID=UPI002939195D|nr:SH3-like domain-containing protein [Mycobacterium sp. 21AC1]MDV3125324.1 nitrile hydratase subunit beta [Mycobacterium sp. 21AC1]